MDSGAGSSFLRAGASDLIETNPVEEKDKGRRWSDAGNHEIKQTGTSTVRFLTDEYAGKRLQLRRSDQVHNNISSVAEMCDTGTFSIFTRHGGAIVKEPTGPIAQRIISGSPGATAFDRVGNVYKLPMWIPISRAARKAAGDRKNEDAKESEGGVKRARDRRRHAARPRPR